MSNLGKYIGYTEEPCPNCGRMRVEKWSCGKRICEKYYYAELEEEEDWHL